MVVVTGLIWDDWNKEHITKHSITSEEVEEICHHKHKTIKTYRQRIKIYGKTKTGRQIKIILSSEDRNLQKYATGIFYPITAFEERIKND